MSPDSPIPGRRAATAPEPNTTVLGRIHASHPGAEVTRVEGGMWQAIVKHGTGERVIIRRQLVKVEERLDELAAKRPAS